MGELMGSHSKRALTTYYLLTALVFSVVVQSSEHKNEHVQPRDKWAKANPDWVEAIEPFKVVDNIYYVGTRGIASFLLTSDQGHVLIDGGMPQNAGLIANSIKSLGFGIRDVKILLNSHAHFDHSGGLAELKELSGATMAASVQDKEALETGLYAGSDNPSYSAPPVKVDKTIEDGESITLSTIKLTANLMPGHSPGCTSWSTKATHQGESYQVLFFCSATVAGNRLVGPPQYPGIVADYRHTFKKSKTMTVDILLANHPFFSELHDKRKRVLGGETDAFIDAEEFSQLMQRLEADFERKLTQQRKALKES